MIFNSLSKQLKIIDDKQYSLPKWDHCNLQPIRMWGIDVKFTLNQVPRNVGRVLHNLHRIPCHIQTIKTYLIENQTRISTKMRIQFIKSRFISHFRTINYIAYKKKKAKETLEHPLTGLGLPAKSLLVAEETAEPGGENTSGLERGFVEEIALDVLHSVV